MLQVNLEMANLGILVLNVLSEQLYLVVQVFCLNGHDLKFVVVYLQTQVFGLGRFQLLLSHEMTLELLMQKSI